MESAYNTSKEASGELVEYLLGGTALNYLGHMSCIHGAIVGTRKERKQVEMAELSRRKELSGGQDSNNLHRATRNGSWLRSIPHRPNGTEFSREGFQDNLRLRYGLKPRDIPATCDGCVKRFSIEHILSFPKGGVVLVQHNNAVK